MNDRTDDDFTAADVGRLVLDAVGVLHSRGHAQLRVLPGVSPSGMYWRVNVTTADNMHDTGYPTLNNWEASFGWSTGAGCEIVGMRVDATTDAVDVADLVLNQLVDQGLGADPGYASWYQRLLELVHQHKALPIAYAEGLESRKGWEVGWTSGVRISPPPGRPRTFGELVSPSSGWYVYALRDASNDRVFFVGEGHGDRVFSHVEHAQSTGELGRSQHAFESTSPAGPQVQGFILRSDLESEGVASEIACATNDMLRLLDPAYDNSYFKLTDITFGLNVAERGLASVDLPSNETNVAPAPTIGVPALLIKIPRLWTPTMDETELYDATRQWWRLGERRLSADYAFAVAHGIIREVYRVDAWEAGWVVNDAWTTDPQNRPPDRWCFAGDVAGALSAQYKNTSVKHLFKAGEANPVRYLNC